VLLVGNRGGSVTELVGLVDDVRGDLAELVAVLACVVGAEQQLATRLELDSEVGLGSATVAAVRGTERGTRSKCSGHIDLISIFVVPVPTYPERRRFPRTPRCDVSSDTHPITAVVPGSGSFHSSGGAGS
jgi:hypothetical protein